MKSAKISNLLVDDCKYMIKQKTFILKIINEKYDVFLSGIFQNDYIFNHTQNHTHAHKHT